MIPAEGAFSGAVVRWQRTHGRHGLPWQGTRDPYRVWLSEIMLQQTQVAAVLAYYPRFLARFPDVATLAGAAPDDVLALWGGLGYYSRARNLHRCAVQVMHLYGGAFPRTAAQLQTLPGIGRSTAAAIAAFCFDERAAILDGNVKRVLTRALAFDADLSVATNERALWDVATGLLPAAGADMPAYTQGVMDLGATVCVARNPHCLLCPLNSTCRALRQDDVARYPVKTRKLKRSAQALWLLVATSADGCVWLERRPDAGVWGGLHCLPAFDDRNALASVLAGDVTDLVDSEPFVHVLTHKDLHLHPVVARVARHALAGREGNWFGAAQWPLLGLPTPIRRLLSAIELPVPLQGDPLPAE